MNGKRILGIALLLSLIFLLSFVLQTEAQTKPNYFCEMEKRLVNVKAVFPSRSGFLGNGRVTCGRGVILTSSIVATVYHLTDGMQSGIYVNGTEVQVFGSSKVADLLFLKTGIGNFKTFAPCLDVKPGTEVMLLRKEPQSGFEWHSAKVVECHGGPDTLCLESAYKLVPGDSGSPVFIQSGEFVGLVRAYTKDPRLIMVTPAKVIYSFIPW